jgi:hypothetical protein
MSKYDALTRFLRHQMGPVEYSLQRLDEIVPGGLPPSAYKHQAWWSNGDRTHSHCTSWAAAGFTAHPDLDRQVVRFELVDTTCAPPAQRLGGSAVGRLVRPRHLSTAS